MVQKTPFAGMSQEDTMTAILMVLVAIEDKLPRTDANDRTIIAAEAPLAVTASGSLTTVSTVTAVSDIVRLQTLGTTATTAKPTDAIPMHLANIGANHIYSMLEIT